ncbi:MAG: hypothetical protein WC785_02875 [Tatlockia sp.]|jgi:hypothetical protein
MALDNPAIEQLPSLMKQYKTLLQQPDVDETLAPLHEELLEIFLENNPLLTEEAIELLLLYPKAFQSLLAKWDACDAALNVILSAHSISLFTRANYESIEAVWKQQLARVDGLRELIEDKYSPRWFRSLHLSFPKDHYELKIALIKTLKKNGVSCDWVNTIQATFPKRDDAIRSSEERQTYLKILQQVHEEDVTQALIDALNTQWPDWLTPELKSENTNPFFLKYALEKHALTDAECFVAVEQALKQKNWVNLCIIMETVSGELHTRLLSFLESKLPNTIYRYFLAQKEASSPETLEYKVKEIFDQEVLELDEIHFLCELLQDKIPANLVSKILPHMVRFSTDYSQFVTIQRLCQLTGTNRPSQATISDALIQSIRSGKRFYTAYFCRLRGDNQPTLEAVNELDVGDFSTLLLRSNLTTNNRLQNDTLRKGLTKLIFSDCWFWIWQLNHFSSPRFIEEPLIRYLRDEYKIENPFADKKFCEALLKRPVDEILRILQWEQQDPTLHALLQQKEALPFWKALNYKCHLNPENYQALAHLITTDKQIMWCLEELIDKEVMFPFIEEAILSRPEGALLLSKNWVNIIAKSSYTLLSHPGFQTCINSLDNFSQLDNDKASLVCKAIDHKILTLIPNEAQIPSCEDTYKLYPGYLACSYYMARWKESTEHFEKQNSAYTPARKESILQALRQLQQELDKNRFFSTTDFKDEKETPIYIKFFAKFTARLADSTQPITPKQLEQVFNKLDKQLLELENPFNPKFFALTGFVIGTLLLSIPLIALATGTFIAALAGISLVGFAPLVVALSFGLPTIGLATCTTIGFFAGKKIEQNHISTIQEAQIEPVKALRQSCLYGG